MKIFDITEYCEGYPVEFDYTPNGRPIIRAINEGGYNATEIDLLELIMWLKINHPDLLKDK